MLEMSREFMAATYNVGMHSNDYVYILPWIRDGNKDAVPWLGTSGETMQKVRDHYENAIMVHNLKNFQIYKKTKSDSFHFWNYNRKNFETN